MNFRVRAKQIHTVICQINAVDSVALGFERTEEVIPRHCSLLVLIGLDSAFEL